MVIGWKKAIGEGKIIGVVFLDLRRAFEVVNRDILIRKIEWYGIKGTVLEWFKSYLKDRSQRVKFNGLLSTPMKVDLGVPQGSVLGPMLFLLYINDITEVINDNCAIRLFADDALIYTIEYSSIEINNKLNEQIVRVEEWLRRNKLSVNVDKTKVMLLRGIRKKTKENYIKVMLQNKVLEVVSEVKYLGVTIDKNLNFSAHIDYMSKKIGSKIGLLRRVGADMTPIMRCVIYKAVIAPVFEYCASILVGANKSDLQHLQTLQNRAMRIILRCGKRTRIVDMLEALQFMNIQQRIDFNTCLLVYNMMNGMCPNYLSKGLQTVENVSAMCTRQRGNIYILISVGQARSRKH